MCKEHHKKLSDNEFEEQFKALNLSPEVFSHEAHLRLAWIHIRKYGVNQAEQNISNQLLAYVVKLGAADKYHTTVTIVAVRIVNHFMKKSECESFDEFIERYPELKSNFKELINKYYSFNVFNSEEARKSFIDPDRPLIDDLETN